MTDNVIARCRSVPEFLREAGAEEFPHANGRSLYDHLVGTQAILRAWSQPEWVCDAGALHSVYGTDVYQRQLISAARRSEVRELAGVRPERLAYLFGTVGRYELFEQIESCGGIPAEGFRVRCRATDGGAEHLSSEDAAALVIIHMANTAEQACGTDGSPALFLTDLSRSGLLVSNVTAAVPPVFDGCRQVVSGEAEATGRDAYSAGLAARSIEQMTLAAVKCPWIAEPLVWLAYFAMQRGANGEAGSWIERARTVSGKWGTAWDKRLSYEEWLWLLDFIASQVEEPEIGPLPAPDPQDLGRFLRQLKKRNWVEVYLGSAANSEPYDTGVSRFHRYVSLFTETDCASQMRVYPGLRIRAWHDAEDFPLARALEAEYDAIRGEILALEERQFAPESEPIARTGRWNVIFFHERGRRNEEVCKRCPVTSSVIDAHRTVRSLAGISYLSRLSPGTHISAHHGPTNLRLRCHFGIRVPSGNCGIRVERQMRQWEEGKCIVFDDFLLHEAWNHTAGDRVVLIVDLWHPDLTDEEVALLEGLHRYTAAQAASLSRYWSSNEKARSLMDDRGDRLC